MTYFRPRKSLERITIRRGVATEDVVVVPYHSRTKPRKGCRSSDKSRQKQRTEGPHASLQWLAVKRGLLWPVKATYMPIFRGIILLLWSMFNGWTRPDPVAVTPDIIGPAAGSTTVIILLPVLIFYGVDYYFFPLVGRHVDWTFIFAYVYSGLFCLIAFTHTFALCEMLAVAAAGSQTQRVLGGDETQESDI
ncbi:hypothetical protein GYMLUDRAFT_243112 [Collybiopsis luxurians FD-317 M1]|uniref:Uncharacterized protein n=1 Tax=Collybiopsis luxurians FD-317 M1 TaxID=944289 RepID=A0A0D0CH29_9AGAR|nr:hypothetical protein GYMLUDRAFT_243112 [Collybiopsis luxurians FD-317 M1]